MGSGRQIKPNKKGQFVVIGDPFRLDYFYYRAFPTRTEKPSRPKLQRRINSNPGAQAAYLFQLLSVGRVLQKCKKDIETTGYFKYQLLNQVVDLEKHPMIQGILFLGNIHDSEEKLVVRDAHNLVSLIDFCIAEVEGALTKFQVVHKYRQYTKEIKE